MIHEHHIIPLYTCTNPTCPKGKNRRKHVCGLDDPSNLIKLTVEEHAEAHKQLWLMNRNWQDEIAYLFLSGQNYNEDVWRIAHKIANTGKEHSLESREKRRIKQLAKIAAGTHIPPTNKGMIRNQEWKSKMSKAMIGNKNGLGTKRTEEQRKKMSAAQKLRFGVAA